MISAEGVSYTYDPIGNLIRRSDAKGTTTYAYDFENQLTAISFPDGTSATYKYDALGRRIEKGVNGIVTTYLYDGTDILLEMDAAGAMQARFTHGPDIDQPLMMERGGQVFFYHGDRAGSIAALTDSSANTVCSYLYDSFGRTQPCQGARNPFGFAGREYDAESGLYYMRARYYDPATGRFLSADPLDLTGTLATEQDRRNLTTLTPVASSVIATTSGLGVPQHLNRYSYAVNNPLVFRDPSGLACQLLQGLQLVHRIAGDTGTQEFLDYLAETNPQAVRQFRDTLANTKVSADLRSYKFDAVLQLNIALIGTSDRPSPAPAAPPPVSPPQFSPQETQQSQQFLDGFSRAFGGPAVNPLPNR